MNRHKIRTIQKYACNFKLCKHFENIKLKIRLNCFIILIYSYKAYNNLKGFLFYRFYYDFFA